MQTRRQFLKTTAGSAAGATLLGAFTRQAASGATVVNGVSPALRKFITPLRGLGPGGIPVATPDKTTYPGVDFYRLGVAQHSEVLHPDLPGPTRLWGYYDKNPAGDSRKVHLGGLIVASQGTPVRVQMSNDLDPLLQGLPHLLPVDLSIPGAADGPRRIATHLHGGFTPWMSDGTPFQTVAPDGTLGISIVKWLPDAGGNLTHDIWYSNQQSPRLMWYHDHTMGITRLNAYAGVASGYLLTGPDEAALIGAGGPLEGLGVGIPLVFQDKVFKVVADQWGGPGDLWYPSLYPKNLKVPFPSCVPEFFGDTMLCNGTPYPALNVEPKRYRFRILNANQAGFLNLSIFYAKKSDATSANTTAPGPNWLQIGTEGGFLPAPVTIRPGKISIDPSTSLAVKYSLLLGPAERADVIVDFSAIPVGSKLIIYNDSPGPFPGGGGAPTAPLNPGLGPDTMNLVQLTVVPLTTPDVSAGRALVLPPITPVNTGGAPILGKTLNEIVDVYGRLIQMLGTTTAVAPGVFARAYMDPPTEVVNAGAVQVWDIFNLTKDTHPMHFHLVNVQVLGRAPFNAGKAIFTPTGPWIAPDANELGFKETVRMNPGQVTRVAMRFDLPVLPTAVTTGSGASFPITVPTSPRTGGHEYVWHCHILEHEEHDMMRPLIVQP